jgi:molybdate transport system regulatory protein
MDSKDAAIEPRGAKLEPLPLPERPSHARIVTIPNESKLLDMLQLNRLEQSFREWAEDSPRPDVRLSRKRILLIFLLIRYTGAKLNEVLCLDPLKDIDHAGQQVFLGGRCSRDVRPARKVQIPERLSLEIKEVLNDPGFKKTMGNLFSLDPAHVRRKFYERALACGFHKALGAPDTIRKSRAVELMQSNMPLPVVQKVLGHSTPNLAASYVKFSDDEIRQVARYYADKENRRKTSARNAFFGKLNRIQEGHIQSIIEITSVGGYVIIAVITNDSLGRLGLRRGTMVTAEVKSPWVMLYKDTEQPKSTAENVFRGTVHRIISGSVTTEVVVRIPDGTELCAVITEESKKKLELKVNDPLWVAFNAFAVVLHVD